MLNHFTHRQRGFTLLEVVSVLVLIGIISAVAISRVMSTTQITLKANAETLKVHLRYAQLRALNNTEKAWGVYFIGGGVYKLYYADTTGTHDVPSPGGDGNTVTLQNVDAITTNDGGSQVSFDKWGKPYMSLRANFDASPDPQTVNRAITLTSGGSTETITITKNTGYIP